MVWRGGLEDKSGFGPDDELGGGLDNALGAVAADNILNVQA